MMAKDLEQLLIRVNLLNNEEINEDVRWDIIDTLNNHLKQLRIGGVSQQRELLVCDNHHADLEHFMNYSESICKTCKQKV